MVFENTSITAVHGVSQFGVLLLYNLVVFPLSGVSGAQWQKLIEEKASEN